jgi:hypothetical protein
MGGIFWLLGPLAAFLCVVVGYGSLGLATSEQGSWADYLFWGTMVLGTLPAVGQLVWLQVQALRRWLDQHPRFQPAVHT